MAMTPAERQRRYRQNRMTAGPQKDGDRKIASWVSSEAFLALARLARKEGTSKRSVLESLILAADDVNLRACETDEELDVYLGVTH